MALVYIHMHRCLPINILKESQIVCKPLAPRYNLRLIFHAVSGLCSACLPGEVEWQLIETLYSDRQRGCVYLCGTQLKEFYTDSIFCSFTFWMGGTRLFWTNPWVLFLGSFYLRLGKDLWVISPNTIVVQTRKLRTYHEVDWHSQSHTSLETEQGLEFPVLLVVVVEGYVQRQSVEGMDVPQDTSPKPDISKVKQWHES